MELDREKVIESVERAFDFMIGDFDGCSDFDTEEAEQEKRDAIELLKEQEPDDPVKLPPHRGFPDGAWNWGCPKCNYQIGYMWNFCPRCGKAVKWDA